MRRLGPLKKAGIILVVLGALAVAKPLVSNLVVDILIGTLTGINMLCMGLLFNKLANAIQRTRTYQIAIFVCSPQYPVHFGN